MYLNKDCGLSGDGRPTNVGCNGCELRVDQSSGRRKAVADAGSARRVKVCQWACSSSPRNACTSSRPVGAR